MNSPDHHFPMTRAARNFFRLGVMLAVLMMAACGKKGPLYLPDDTGPGQSGGQAGNFVVSAIKE